MDDGTVTVKWRLYNGLESKIVAVFTAGDLSVTKVLATNRKPGDSGTSTIPDVYAADDISVELYASYDDIKSDAVEATFEANLNPAASTPSDLDISLHENMHLIEASGTVELAQGTTSAWLEYGATTDYGSTIDLSLDEEGAWAKSFFYDEALWLSGKAYIRATASNEVESVFGTLAFQESSDAVEVEFSPVRRSIELTAFDAATGEGTFAFDTGFAAHDVVVAWGAKDYGESLSGWPYTNRFVLGSIEANESCGKFAIPEEVSASGAYCRFFLGYDATEAYDEEVEWIQPETLGAYIKTDFLPSQRPWCETKLNLDSQSYTNEWVTLFDAGTSWANGVWVYANEEGRIGARRAGYADFGPFSTTDDLTVAVLPRLFNPNYFSISVNGQIYAHNNYNQSVSMTPDTTVSFWRYVNSSYGHSTCRLYWSKWWNADKSELEAHFIPVRKNGEYGICDVVGGTVSLNCGKEGTSFKGGARVDNRALVIFASGQASVSCAYRLGESVTGADSLTATNGAYWFDPHETGTDRSDNYIYDDALLLGDSKNFSWPLATMSFELACVSFSSEREENTPEGYANKCRNVKAYLEDNGFVDFDTNQDYKEKMTVQSMGVACAHKRIADSESETGETTVLAIVPRCAGYEAEWGGNFVMGETGDHAGFAHGKDKVLEFAKAYIETNSISGRIKVWAVGYSRGAGVMNQVGAEILRDAEQALGSGVSLAPGDFYCYTFATPKSAGIDTDYDDTGFAYIHNVWEGYDMMTALPFKVLGFARYGRDYHFAAIGDKEWMLELLEDLNPDVYEKYMTGGDPDGFKPKRTMWRTFRTWWRSWPGMFSAIRGRAVR